MKRNTALVDEHLQSFQKMQEATTDDFFYTRLKARMENRGSSAWSLPLRPVWVICTLVLLLIINGFMLRDNVKTKKQQQVSSSGIQGFAEAYDQNITTY